jgi:formylglycine-generating enzyme required for sulfatase activity
MSPLLLAIALDPVAVPAGSFQQGNGRDPDAPTRTVTLSAYRIDRTEVTIDDFERFAREAWRQRGWWTDEGWAWAQDHPGGAGSELRAAGRRPDHPVVAVTWYEADAYCRAVGGSLPTEAQWEHAACGDGLRRFPWGDSEEVSASWSSYGKFGQAQSVDTQPAGQQDASLRSPLGLLHAGGNVWEWTADGYHREGNSQDVVTDPQGVEGSAWRVLKGGAFTSLPSSCACAHREPATPDRVAFTTGFRCAYGPVEAAEEAP